MTPHHEMNQPTSNRYKYLGIEIDRKNPTFLSEFSKVLFQEGDYLKGNETIPMALARPAINFCYGDYELAQRIYDYVYNGWFMYASPVLSNATAGNWYPDESKDGAHYWHKSTFIPNSKPEGQPISCFAFEVPDTIEGQEDAIKELARLSVSGGGTGAHNRIRATTKKAPGPIPYMKVLDGAIGYFKQKGTRKGALAYYLDVDHPDIKEHIRFRVPGGDSKRRSDNRTQFHSGVNLTDVFIEAVLKAYEYDLKCPHSGKVYETLSARSVWEDLLETRFLTGEPFLTKIDLINRLLPETQRRLGLKCRGSNLCLAGDTKVTILRAGENSQPEDATLESVVGTKQLKVLSYNHKTKQTEFKKITNSALMNKSAKVLRLTDTESSKQLVCTPEHKVWTKNRGYVMAKDLKATDKLTLL